MDTTQASDRPQYIATAGLETAPLQDGAVLYNLKTGKFVMLNRPAAFLWTSLSMPKTEDELIAGLCASFSGVSSLAATRAVRESLEKLQELELASKREPGTVVGAPSAASLGEVQSRGTPVAYEQPSIRVLDEEELLKIFQMTAAEISVASCWWATCPTGCP